jgi:MFS transporter, FSR family, fosmidomycin resistance protein
VRGGATRRALRGSGLFVFTLLAIELLDELVFGVREAAWPAIQRDLNLDYVQIGLLTSIPNVASGLIEPVLGILGDVWRRKVIVLVGGVVFGLALLLTAASNDYWILMLAMVLLFPASGAFVSLSQATLMDTDPSRHEQNMARWTFAGSVGAVAGTAAVGAGTAFGVDWRVLFLAMAVLTFLLIMVARRFSFPSASDDEQGDKESEGIAGGLRGALAALRRGEVVRWLALLQFSDLMLDILHAFLALYFANVVGIDEAAAAFAVTLWIGFGLVGDFLLIPLLVRVRGLSYLRVSAALLLVLYPAFLLAPELWQKLVLLAMIGVLNAGWYAILQGNLYTSMPGRSGTVLALSNIAGLAGGMLPLLMGWLAEVYGLGNAMWLLLVGPVALLVGIPGRRLGRSDA